MKIQRYDIKLWKYEYKMWKHGENNIAPFSAVFAGLIETTFKIRYNKKNIN
jgi:hypothetical protein